MKQPVPPPLIVFQNVSRIYSQGLTAVHALDGVSLEIEKGEFLAVMGPSGSGKSTFMNILGCLDSPTSGSYLFNGVEITTLSRNQRALLRRYRLGFVFQGFNLLNRTSALENVELPLLYRRVPSSRRKRQALHTLAQVGLKGWEHHTPGELSGGQQQRVAIARAMVTEPSILLADEPTGNLDSVKSREIMTLLKTLNEDHKITVVMVTHESDMATYAHRIIRFLDGKIEKDRSPGLQVT